ncbi:MAG: FecR domain-containing protein [Syntrophobacteraceae bacterium]|nr:FecR domain-containing protein [Syntrophobacteraceae bacterium]
MNRRATYLLVLMLSFVLISGSPLVAADQPDSSRGSDQQEPVLVGRIFHIEGELLRYDGEEKQWVDVLPDSPWGEGDALYSVEESRAEMILPTNIWVRIGPTTEIELVALTPQKTEIDLVSGTARFLNKSSDVPLKVTTPYGYVLAQGGSVLDIYAATASVEVFALEGKVEFIHEQTGSRFEVVAGSTSLLVDEKQVGPGTGCLDAAWGKWNETRDAWWAKRLACKGESVKYLHDSIREDACILDEHGRWSRVYYEGAYHHFWRPTRVGAGWAPFTAGSWMYWHGDWCWVPAEPFGYVTHHYGNWVLVGASWYWAPPLAVTVAVGGPFSGIGIGFGWYPGRVAWVYSHDHIGWIPLAPGEIYYSHRYWGPGSLVLGAGVVGVATLHDYRYAHHAVIIKRSHFSRVTNYRKVVVKRPGRAALFKNYKAARVANDKTIPGFAHIKHRRGFSASSPREKPTSAQIQKARKGRLGVDRAGSGDVGRKHVIKGGKSRQAGRASLKSSPAAKRSPGRMSQGRSKSPGKSVRAAKGFDRSLHKDKGRKSIQSRRFAGRGADKHVNRGKPVHGHGPPSENGKRK